MVIWFERQKSQITNHKQTTITEIKNTKQTDFGSYLRFVYWNFFILVLVICYFGFIRFVKLGYIFTIQ